jgi:hypothetical protein
MKDSKLPKPVKGIVAELAGGTVSNIMTPSMIAKTKMGKNMQKYTKKNEGEEIDSGNGISSS